MIDTLIAAIPEQGDEKELIVRGFLLAAYTILQARSPLALARSIAAENDQAMGLQGESTLLGQVLAELLEEAAERS